MPSPRLALFTVAATLAYLGLAIHGRGGFAAFFSHSALIAVPPFVAMTGVALFSEGNLSSGEREDRGNRWVIVAFVLIGMLAAYLPAYTDRKDFWTLDGEYRSLARRRSVRRRWRAADLAGLRARPPVQRAGRHPARAYAGHQRCLRRHPPPQLSGIAGQFARVGPRLSLGGRRVAAALSIPPLLARINAEERLLRSQFGAEYDAYRARTSRLIPGLY